VLDHFLQAVATGADPNSDLSGGDATAAPSAGTDNPDAVVYDRLETMPPEPPFDLVRGAWALPRPREGQTWLTHRNWRR
jgi:hypothetical protein